MQIDITTLFEILAMIGSLVGVYVRLNNKIIELKAEQKYINERLGEENKKMSAFELDYKTNAKDVTTALHENSIAIRELKVTLTKYFTK